MWFPVFFTCESYTKLKKNKEIFIRSIPQRFILFENAKKYWKEYLGENKILNLFRGESERTIFLKRFHSQILEIRIEVKRSEVV